MAKGSRKMRMAFVLPDGDGTPMNVPCMIQPIKTDHLREKPIIVLRDSAGKEVKAKTVLKSALREGRVETAQGLTTRVMVNEDNELVKEHECQNFLVTENGEEEIDPYEANIGGGKTVEVSKFVDIEKKDDYFMDKAFEVLVSPDDSPMLWKLADWLDKNGKMGVIDLVEREAFEKDFGMVVPMVDRTAGKWTIMVYRTKAKMAPVWNDVPTKDSIEKARAKKAKKTRKTVKQDDIF